MSLNRSFPLTESNYFREPQKKDLIVLHHTAGGSARSTMRWWEQDPRRVGTAYVVERDGMVFECFPDDGWAFHLGLKGIPIGELDKRSIGIEIASEGGLLRAGDGGDEFYAFDEVSARTRYRGEIYDCQKVWRGYRYYAAYMRPAVEAVFGLVRDLLAKYGIPQQTPEDHVNAKMPDYRSYRGVLTHSQLRADKSDVHPGFPWEELVEHCGLVQT